MSTTRPSEKNEPAQSPPEAAPEGASEEEPGTNAVQHEPDPRAEPLPDAHHKYHPRSPYTSGND
jgi:hypothetical protein